MGLPDGHEWTGRQTEIKLIDPTDCPAGHPFRWGRRGGPDQCGEHGSHFRWLCACGQPVWRYDGEFAGEWRCG